MIESKTAHVFLDANTALHFLRPDQIDWCELTGCRQVVLVGAPILHRELEQQKVHNPSAKLRKRAAAYIKWQVEFVRDPAREVRLNTRWHFIPLEPPIDFTSSSLSTAIADDHLIASVLTYARPEHAAVYVATADIGLEIKLRYRQITPLLLPESAKLPDEPDTQEKELQELRKRLAQRHLPDLALIAPLSPDQHPLKLAPRVTLPSAPPLQQMLRDFPAIRLPDKSSAARDAIEPLFRNLQRYADLVSSAFLSPERVSNYNQERETFFAEYEKYLARLLEWEEQTALTVDLELTLSNTGTAPATDIDVILHFPAELILFRGVDLPKRPKKPVPPVRPDRVHGVGLGEPLKPSYLDAPYPNHPELHGHSGLSVDADKRQINYWSRSLKHGFTEKLDDAHFRFPDRQSVRQFHVEYEISSAELPEPVEGILNFVLPETK